MARTGYSTASYDMPDPGDYFRPAGIFVRFIAWIIDAAVLVGLLEVFLFFIRKEQVTLYAVLIDASDHFRTYLFQELLLSWAEIIPLGIYLAGILTLLVLLVGFFYSSLAECSRSGGSLGKVLCGIKVVSNESRQISFIQAVLRNLFKTVTLLSLGFGMFLALFNEDRQAFHDFIPDTFVVRKIDSNYIQLFFATIFGLFLVAFVGLLIVRDNQAEVIDSLVEFKEEVQASGGVVQYAKDLAKRVKYTAQTQQTLPSTKFEDEFEGLGIMTFQEQKVVFNDVVVRLRNLIKDGRLEGEVSNLDKALAIEIFMFREEVSSARRKQLENGRRLRSVFGSDLAAYPALVTRLSYPITEPKCYPEKITSGKIELKSSQPEFTLAPAQAFIVQKFAPNLLRKRGHFASSCNKLKKGEDLKISFRYVASIPGTVEKALVKVAFNKKLK